jgi:hypothetical protein
VNAAIACLLPGLMAISPASRLAGSGTLLV